jgi:hypothetical protein
LVLLGVGYDGSVSSVSSTSGSMYSKISCSLAAVLTTANYMPPVSRCVQYHRDLDCYRGGRV